MDDFSGMLSGLSVAAALTAILGAGAIKAAPGFARWLTEKVSSFFDNNDDSEEDSTVCEPCDFCGEVIDLEEDYWHHQGDEIMCGACSRDDSRWA